MISKRDSSNCDYFIDLLCDEYNERSESNTEMSSPDVKTPNLFKKQGTFMFPNSQLGHMSEMESDVFCSKNLMKMYGINTEYLSREQSQNLPNLTHLLE